MGTKQTITLAAQKRSTHGKKVRQLRREGILPAVISGKDFTSLPVTVNLRDFDHTYKKARHTTVIELDVEGTRIPALIHQIKKDLSQRELLHVDFLKVAPTSKVAVDVPVTPAGPAPVEGTGRVTVSQETTTVRVKGLPEDIPERLPVDLSPLTEVSSLIRVSDIPLPKGLRLSSKADPDKIVFSVSPIRVGTITAEEAPEEEETVIP